MSLQTEADGILETHVTWADVERELQAALKTKARLGAKKDVVHVGEGNGFLSRIGLITCDWEGAEAGEQLPEKFALKMASCLAAKAMNEATPIEMQPPPEVQKQMWDYFEAFLRDTHNAEVKSYAFLSKFAEKIAVPRCFYSVPFSAENKSAGSLALEYLDNTRINHVYQTLTIDQLREVARELGKMQALSVLHHVEKEQWLAEHDVYTAFWKNFSVEIFADMFKPLKEMDTSMVECVEAVTHLAPVYYGSNLPITLHTQFEGVRPVLVNGDMWSANVLIDKGTEKVRALIDWQLAHQGTPVEDLHRIAMSGLSSKDRRAHMPELLDEMYEAMLATLDGAAPAPYTREQMLELHDLILPHAGFFFAPVAMPIFMTTINSPDLSDEEKEKRRAIVMDKVRGICEDIVTYHEKNEKSGRKFEWRSPDFEAKKVEEEK